MINKGDIKKPFAEYLLLHTETVIFFIVFLHGKIAVCNPFFMFIFAVGVGMKPNATIQKRFNRKTEAKLNEKSKGQTEQVFLEYEKSEVAHRKQFLKDFLPTSWFGWS